MKRLVRDLSLNADTKQGYNLTNGGFTPGEKNQILVHCTLLSYVDARNSTMMAMRTHCRGAASRSKQSPKSKQVDVEIKHCERSVSGSKSVRKLVRRPKGNVRLTTVLLHTTYFVLLYLKGVNTNENQPHDTLGTRSIARCSIATDYSTDPKLFPGSSYSYFGSSLFELLFAY